MSLFLPAFRRSGWREGDVSSAASDLSGAPAARRRSMGACFDRAGVDVPPPVDLSGERTGNRRCRRRYRCRRRSGLPRTTCREPRGRISGCLRRLAGFPHGEGHDRARCVPNPEDQAVGQRLCRFDLWEHPCASGVAVRRGPDHRCHLAVSPGRLPDLSSPALWSGLGQKLHAYLPRSRSVSEHSRRSAPWGRVRRPGYVEDLCQSAISDNRLR